jgi:hypothetical protein
MNRAKPKLAPDLAKRAERLTATIAALKVKIQQIFDEGEVAPKGCYVARYQVRQIYFAFFTREFFPLCPKSKANLVANLVD